MSESEEAIDWSIFRLHSEPATKVPEAGPESYAAPISKGRPRRQRPFFAGPVDMEWLCRAAVLPGAAFKVAVMLCHLGKLSGVIWVPISNVAVKPFGVSPDAKTRGLTELEAAGLIEVKRTSGRSPRVRLIEAML